MRYPAFYFAAGLCFLLGPGLLQAQTPAPVLKDGQIKAFQTSGDVQLQLADGSKRALNKGEIFGDGTIVITGPDGHTLLVLSNGATLKMDPNAQLEIKTYKQEPFDAKAAGGTFIALTKDPSKSITNLNLINGTVSGEVKALDETAGSTFTVDTPAGSADVSRGDISLSVARDAAGQIVNFTAHDNIEGGMTIRPHGSPIMNTPASMRHHPGSFN
jgi:hypothetical protein